MRGNLKIPVGLLVGTWGVNAPAKEQLKQLPTYMKERAKSLSAGTVLKYLFSGLAEGIKVDGDRYFVSCKIPLVKRRLGEGGNDYSTPRAALTMSQNLLFRPLNQTKAITTERLVIGVITDPAETEDKTEVIIEISPKYAKAFLGPKQYINLELLELGKLRESGNIFLYLSFLRYNNIDLSFLKNDLAILTTKPNQTSEERLAYFESQNNPARAWSLMRRELMSKIKNIEKHTSLRVNIGKPKKERVLVSIRRNSQVSKNEEFNRFVRLFCQFTGAKEKGVSNSLYPTYQQKGLAFLNERFNWLNSIVSIRSDSKFTINGREVGVGLMIVFVAGRDNVFPEFSPQKIVKRKEFVAYKQKPTSKIQTAREVLYLDHLNLLCNQWLIENTINEKLILSKIMKRNPDIDVTSIYFEEQKKKEIVLQSGVEIELFKELGVIRRNDAIIAFHHSRGKEKGKQTLNYLSG